MTKDVGITSEKTKSKLSYLMIPIFDSIIRMIPSSCKECKYKCKGIARGSKKCKIRLGIKKEVKEESISKDKFATCLLWYYYNSTKDGSYEE